MDESELLGRLYSPEHSCTVSRGRNDVFEAVVGVRSRGAFTEMKATRSSLRPRSATPTCAQLYSHPLLSLARAREAAAGSHRRNHASFNLIVPLPPLSARDNPLSVHGILDHALEDQEE